MVISWLQPDFPNALVEAFNDVVAAVVSGTNGVLNGFAVIAGTGSNCMAVEGAHQEFAGGWGPLLGSGGSGHSISSAALAACCRAIDGRGPSTILVEQMEKALGWDAGSFSSVILGWMYDNGGRRTWAEVASLAPVVFNAEAAGDPVAVSIIKDAAAEQALAVETVARKMGWTDDDCPPRPLVLVGSLWKQPSMLHSFVDELNLRKVPHRIVLPDISAAQGAALLARRSYLARE